MVISYTVHDIMVRTYTTSSGSTVLVGESAAENQQLCKQARQNDQWFHIDAAPSAHAVLQCGGRTVSRDDVHDCSQLVKHFSKLRCVPHLPTYSVAASDCSLETPSVRTSTIYPRNSCRKTV